MTAAIAIGPRKKLSVNISPTASTPAAIIHRTHSSIALDPRVFGLQYFARAAQTACAAARGRGRWRASSRAAARDRTPACWPRGPGAPASSSANSRRLSRSAPATCSTPARSVRGQLEQRGGEVADLDRAAHLVGEEAGARVGRQALLRPRLGPAVDQRGAHHQRARMGVQHAALGVGLGAAVVGQRRRLVLLDVRRALLAVEHHVGRHVHEPGADRGRRGATWTAPSKVVARSSWR